MSFDIPYRASASTLIVQLFHNKIQTEFLHLIQNTLPKCFHNIGSANHVLIDVDAVSKMSIGYTKTDRTKMTQPSQLLTIRPGLQRPTWLTPDVPFFP